MNPTSKASESPKEFKQHELKQSSALIMIFVFSISMLFLNSEGIQKDLELLPYGNHRTTCLKVFRPIVEFSRKVRLTRPKIWLERTAGAWLKHDKIEPEPEQNQS